MIVIVTVITVVVVVLVVVVVGELPAVAVVLQADDVALEERDARVVAEHDVVAHASVDYVGPVAAEHDVAALARGDGVGVEGVAGGELGGLDS